MMRHTYASRLIAAGIPTIAVQQAMGYANARMLQRYVHFNASSLQAAMR